MKRPRHRPWSCPCLRGGLTGFGLAVLLALPTWASFPPPEPPDKGDEVPPTRPLTDPLDREEPDPLPIRRLQFPSEALLPRPERGELRQLAIDDFEALVSAARDRLARQDKPPRLLGARYRARLTGEALTGTAQWRIRHDWEGPALLNLEADGQPFNLALGRPRFENRDAPLARFLGPHLALLVDRPGEHAVALEWSARGEARPEGLRFGLQMPRCPVASLELDLPADRTVTDLGGSVLSGPHPAEDPQRRLWKVLFSGRSRVDLLVRRSPPEREGPGEEGALLLAQLQTVQELGPDGLEATYAFALEAIHRGVRELTCTCSPGLKPQEIDAPHLERWDFAPGKGPADPGRLTVRLKRPLIDGLLRVRCLAPLGPPVPDAFRGDPRGEDVTGERVRWECPALRVEGALFQGETLEIILHSDLRWEDWDPGDYRLVEAEPLSPARPTPPRQAAPTPYRLKLEGGGIQPGEGPRRPAATLTTSGVDYRARQLVWWRPEPEGMALTLQIDYEVKRGRLFRLPILLPDGWEVGAVKAQPGGRLHNLVVQQGPRIGRPRGPKASLLVVELDRPLEAPPSTRRPDRKASGPRHPSPPGGGPPNPADIARGVPTLASGPEPPPSRLRLTVELRPVARSPQNPAGNTSPSPDRGPAGPLPFPGAFPLGARFLEGGLGITFDPRVYTAKVENAPAHQAPGTVPAEGPWGEKAPQLYYPFFDTDRLPAAGLFFPRSRLLLDRQPARLRAHCHNEVIASPDRALVQTRLTLEATAGNPQAVDLFFSGADPGEVRALADGTDAVTRVERLFHRDLADGLNLLGANTPLGLAGAEAARPRGTYWRVHLRRPLHPGTPLTLSLTQDLANRTEGASAFLWQVPLPAGIGAGLLQGEVTLRLSGMGPATVQTLGLRKGPPPGRTRAAGPPGRTFHHDNPWVALTLRGQDTRPARAPDRIRVDQALLTTSLGPGGTLHHAFRFRVTGWSAPTLPLRLPAGARVLMVRLDDTWLARPRVLEPARPDEEKGHAQADGETGPPPETPVGTEIALPVPDRKDGQTASAWTYEVFYLTAEPSGVLWQELQTPTPVLPVTPLALRRIWYLPPDVRPVSPDRFRRLPGGLALRTPGQAGDQGRAFPADLFRLMPLPGDLLSAGSGDADRAVPPTLRQALAGEEDWEGLTLPQWLHQLVDKLPGYVLIVDRLALRRSGLSLGGSLPEGESATPGAAHLTFLVSRPPSGLGEQAATPGGGPGGLRPPSSGASRCPPLLLITTQGAFPSSQSTALSSSLSLALADAARYGRDPSGRFWLLASWLWEPHTRESLLLSGPGGDGGFSDPAASWTAWEEVAGHDPDAAFLVVRQDRTAAGGLILAAVLAAILWLGRGSPRFRGGLLLCWLGFAGASLFWLPPALQDLAWWPVLLGCVVAPVLALPLLRQAPHAPPPDPDPGPAARDSSPPPPTKIRGGPAAVVGLLLACCLVPVLMAQEPDKPPPMPRERESPARDRGTPASPGGLPSREDPPPPARSPIGTVYLLPGTEGKRRVLAPPALLERLRDLARPQTLGAHLVAADYEGELVDGAAEFGATFRIHHAEDAPAELVVPLGGVGLVGSVWLDGARARVKPLARAERPEGPGDAESPPEGYTVTVAGRGPHQLQLRFRVPVRQAEGSSRLWFSAPPLAENRLRLTLPRGAAHANAAGALGKLAVTADTEGGRPILGVDLGPLRTPVLIGWQVPVPGAPSPRVRYAEAYLWDLRPADCSLTAFLRYEVTGGAVPSLMVNLPEGLEVRQCFAVGRPEGAFPPPPAEKANQQMPEGMAPPAGDRPPEGPLPREYRLRDWQVVPGPDPQYRRVQLHFEQPVSGVFDVTLKLCRRQPLPPVVDLFPLPLPEGGRVAGAGHLAYRAPGLQARPGKLLRVTGIKPEAFAPFWEGPSRPDPGSLEYACTLPARSLPGQPPAAAASDPTLQLRLTLRQPGLRATTQEVKVRVGATHAEVEAITHWKGDGERTSLVEWRLQPASDLQISDVEGPEVYRWAQSGDRLQVWLRQAVRETAIRLSGRQRLARLPGEQPGRLTIPALRPVMEGAATARPGAGEPTETTLRIETREGLGLTPEQLRHLEPIGGTEPPSGQSLVYRARSPAYGGTIAVRREAEWHVRSWISVEGKVGNAGGAPARPTFVAAVECRPAPASRKAPQSVRVRLSHPEGAKVTLEGEAVARAEARGDPEGQTWDVELKPGTNHPVVLVLRGPLAGGDAPGGWPLPRIRVSGAVRTEQGVSVGPGLQAREMTGLEPIPSAPEWVHRPGIVPSPEQTWKAAEEGWGLKVVPARSGYTPRIRVDLAEAEATLTDGERWLHRIEYQLGHEAGADLDLTLPAEARVVAAAVEGRPVAPVQVGWHIWVPLPEAAGLRRVWICWRYEQGEPLDRPHFYKPKVGEAGPDGKASDEYPVLWTLDVPPGWNPKLLPEAGGAGPLGTGWARVAEVELHRAAAQLRAHRDVPAGDEADPNAPGGGAGRLFSLHCRRAEQALSRLAVAGEGGSDGPNGEVRRLNSWLSALQAEGPPREPGATGAEPPEPGRPALEELVGGKDVPFLWYTPPEAPAPGVELESDSPGRIRWALAGSVLWLGFVGGLGFLASSPRRRARAHHFGPELLLALGGVGWVLAGPTPVAVGLLVAGMGTRAIHLTRQVQGWLSRPAPQPAEANGSQGG